LGDEARLRRAAEMPVVLQRDEILQLFERREIGLAQLSSPSMTDWQLITFAN
jgi:hypothetical protein